MTRKELAQKLGEHLLVLPLYKGAPSFAYQVGDYIVDREGIIRDEGGQAVELEELLSQEQEEESTLLQTDTEAALEVELPLEGYQGRSLRNLVRIIYSKQPLLKKALELEEDLVDEETLTALDQEPMNTREHFQNALNGRQCPGITFDFEKETITFKLGPGGEDPEKVEAATKLMALLNKTVRRQKRNVSAKIKPADNEKYAFRTWLLRLGMIGDDYKTARRVLLENLSGNAAFRQQEAV